MKEEKFISKVSKYLGFKKFDESKKKKALKKLIDKLKERKQKIEDKLKKVKDKKEKISFTEEKQIISIKIEKGEKILKHYNKK